MKNNKIEYIRIGQADHLNNWLDQQKTEETEISELKERMYRFGILSIITVFILFILLIFANIPQDDPYEPAPGALDNLTRKEILELENEREASKMLDAQVSRGGHNIRTMEATAYTWSGNKTASGVWPEVGMVAVDPTVIPLGTQMYIEGYGPAIAADTGGDIKGNRIDLYMDTDVECWEFGRQEVRVKIIE